MFVLPQSTNDIFGILHKYTHIPWHAEASSTIDHIEQKIYPEYAFELGKFDWGSKLGDYSPWISILFPKHMIALSHYVFKSPSHLTLAYFPKCWDLYGKKDNAWVKISSVTESGLNGNNKTKVFPMYVNIFFKGFKFHMTCKNYLYYNSQNPPPWEDQYMIFFCNQIDFFGIIHPHHVSATIHITRYLPLFSIFLLISD